jgi:hypothetical protein
MDCNELLILLTLGAVAPYLAEAAISRIRLGGGHQTGARAPAGFRCHNTRAND